jgi:hypothetical protein
MTSLDHGIRCEMHIGEVFQVHCTACDIAATEHLATHPPTRYVTYIPNSECPQHQGYPLPCDRCSRDQGIAS